MKVELDEREISVIQCALWLAKDQYRAFAECKGPGNLIDQFTMQASEAETLYNKLETL